MAFVAPVLGFMPKYHNSFILRSSVLTVATQFHSFFSFLSPSIEIVYVDISSSGRSWQRGYGSISSPLSPVVAGRGGDPDVLDFALLAVQFPSGSCGLA